MKGISHIPDPKCHVAIACINLPQIVINAGSSYFSKNDFYQVGKWRIKHKNTLKEQQKKAKEQ